MSGSRAELAGLVLSITPIAISAFEYSARTKTLETGVKRVLGRIQEALEKCHRLDMVPNIQEWKEMNREPNLAFWTGEDSGLFKMLPHGRIGSSELERRLCAQLVLSESTLVDSGSNAENCRSLSDAGMTLARISRAGHEDEEVGTAGHIVDSIINFIFDPSPAQFIVGFTLLSVGLALLYRRRMGDRYQNVIVAGFVSIVSFGGWVAGEGAMEILVKYLPATIAIALLSSELAHCCMAAPKTVWTDEEWKDEKKMSRSTGMSSWAEKARVGEEMRQQHFECVDDDCHGGHC